MVKKNDPTPKDIKKIISRASEEQSAKLVSIFAGFLISRKDVMPDNIKKKLRKAVKKS